MRSVIYTRASLDQTGEGKSNSRQRGECLRLIEYKRWDLVEVGGQSSVDDISISAYGGKLRPGWERILKMIEAGEVDVVVAWHLDRLTRNMADLERLILLCEEHGVLVATATGDIDLTNDTGRMVARILAAVARQEVERKAARQKLAHVQRRSEGKPWLGVKILGYNRDGSVNEVEAKAMRQAADDIINDRVGMAELGRRWTSQGLTSPYQRMNDDGTRKPWTRRGIANLLTNPRIAGYVTSVEKPSNKVTVLGRGGWEPILDETTFTLLGAKLADPGRRTGTATTGRLPANLLTGIMRCGTCGKTMRAGKVSSTGPAYVCGDSHVSVGREVADEFVRSVIAATVAAVAPGSVVGDHGARASTEDIAEQVEALRSRQATLTRVFGGGSMPEREYEAAMGDLGAQVKALEARGQVVGQEIEWEKVRAESVRGFLSQSMADQRIVLDRLAEVTLHRRIGNRTDPKDRIEIWVKGKRGDAEIRIPGNVIEGREK
ncbi:MAG: recombinase family protein [Nocardioides sp.]|uniref:recombinase family protein n=1 Tax=Nocardioides sp. TaxID=35761 RepID=UPI003D6B2106